jgi:ribonuclease P protein component
MLPAERRVRRRDEFTATVRDGRRAAAPGLVGHLSHSDPSHPARAGFIVSRAVGSAVTRNRVRRQLRHLIAPRLAAMPDGTDLVIRVTPTAVSLRRSELATNLEQMLDRAATEQPG